MKNIIGIIISLIAGSLIGLFGVIVSVFVDGGMTERLVTIGIILLIYGVLGGVWGFLLPSYSWKWGLLMGAPGVLLLGVYMLSENIVYYLVYMVFILFFACFGAWGGTSVKKRKKN